MCDSYNHVPFSSIPPEPSKWPSPPPGMKAKALRYYDFRDHFGHDHRRLVSMQGSCPRINVRQTVRSKRVVEKLQELWRPKRPVYNDNGKYYYSGEDEDRHDDDDVFVDDNDGISKVDKFSGRLPYLEYGFNCRPPSRPRKHYYRGYKRRADLYRPAYVDDSPRSDSDADLIFDSPVYDSSRDDSSCSSPATVLPSHPFYDRDYSGFSDYEDEEDELGCEKCPLLFDSHDAVEDHMDEEDHWAPRYGCEMCERKYLSLEAVGKHMDALEHRVPRYNCETCPAQYATVIAAQQHMDHSDHWKQVIRCEPCGLDFLHEEDLKTHHESHIHWGHKVGCFFCGGRFVSSTGITHHLESNSCRYAANIDRTALLLFMRERDQRCIVTKPQISWTEESSEKRNVIRFDESIYDLSLKQYQCPNNTLCQRDFVSLAALLNHLECGSCGFTNFNEIYRLMMEKDDGGLEQWLERIVMFMTSCRTRLDG